MRLASRPKLLRSIIGPWIAGRRKVPSIHSCIQKTSSISIFFSTSMYMSPSQQLIKLIWSEFSDPEMSRRGHKKMATRPRGAWQQQQYKKCKQKIYYSPPFIYIWIWSLSVYRAAVCTACPGRLCKNHFLRKKRQIHYEFDLSKSAALRGLILYSVYHFVGDTGLCKYQYVRVPLHCGMPICHACRNGWSISIICSSEISSRIVIRPRDLFLPTTTNLSIFQVLAVCWCFWWCFPPWRSVLTYKIS